MPLYCQYHHTNSVTVSMPRPFTVTKPRLTLTYNKLCSNIYLRCICIVVPEEFVISLVHYGHSLLRTYLKLCHRNGQLTVMLTYTFPSRQLPSDQLYACSRKYLTPDTNVGEKDCDENNTGTQYESEILCTNGW